MIRDEQPTEYAVLRPSQDGESEGRPDETQHQTRFLSIMAKKRGLNLETRSRERTLRSFADRVLNGPRAKHAATEIARRAVRPASPAVGQRGRIILGDRTNAKKAGTGCLAAR